jgi:hypothetical protein
MAHPTAEEFFRTLLATMEDLPPGLAGRLEEVLKQRDVDRSHAIRELFEEFAGEANRHAARE